MSSAEQEQDGDTGDGYGGDNTSAESAAIARGAARTAAARGTRTIMAGRLPVSSSSVVSKASKTITRAKPTPRVIPRIPKAPRIRVPKARANTIARASDRAAKGFDVLTAGLEQNDETTKGAQTNANDTSSKKKSTSSSIRKSATQVLQQVSSFGKIFVTNTILGIAVFATYEEVIEHVAPSEQTLHHMHNNMIAETEADDTRDDADENYSVTTTTDVMDRATLPQHCLAGLMAGTSHAVLSLVMMVKRSNADAATSTIHHSNTTIPNLIERQKPIHLQYPALNYSAAYILHHSLAHCVLFGSYQWTKRVLIERVGRSGSSNNDTLLHVGSIALAGGLAGQSQHVTSHLSEQCLGLIDEVRYTSTSSFLRRLKHATWPTWRSTWLAFPPSAIGFLAFEYGRFILDH